jgi:uncharacterized membrane protein
MRPWSGTSTSRTAARTCAAWSAWSWTPVARRRAARDVNRLHDAALTVGQRVADHVAATMGSWRFILLQSLVLAAWIGVNATALLRRSWDPYPFILLNLMLSFQAAYAAPIIMMSQNRQAAKDRLQAELDLQTDLKAETLIEELHGNMDDLRMRQWQALLQIQQCQIELLQAVTWHVGGPPTAASRAARRVGRRGAQEGSARRTRQPVRGTPRGRVGDSGGGSGAHAVTRGHAGVLRVARPQPDPQPVLGRVTREEQQPQARATGRATALEDAVAVNRVAGAGRSA